MGAGRDGTGLWLLYFLQFTVTFALKINNFQEIRCGPIRNIGCEEGEERKGEEKRREER